MNGAFWLIAAALMSAAASVLHLVCLVAGPQMYRFLGAGEQVAIAAELGYWYPAIMTVVIAAMLAVWSAYALSAAGFLGRLPLIRIALTAIALVLIIRSLLYFVREQWRPDLSHSFMVWLSCITFLMGLCFAIGTAKMWSHLSIKEAP